MNINDIIGKGKDFEPPFNVRFPHCGFALIRDSKGIVIAECGNDDIANHICELLNKKHHKQRRMCLRDRTKVCNYCHDCDIDVLNPGNKFAGY